MTQTTSKISVQILLEALLHHGIEDLVFSPGSRNAPLVIGLVGSGKFRSICIHDERSAAFFAMGMALVSRKPVPVLCTSGSALLNYSPAVAEAYYQRIPFMVISADRPLHWIDQGDGQTIRQNGIYANFIDYQVSFPEEATSSEMQVRYNESIQTALNFAQYGPVHVNMPFEEPLYNLMDYSPLKLIQTKTARATANLDDTEYSSLLNDWTSHEKRMVIVGQLTPNSGLEKAIAILANDSKNVVLTENISNVEIEGIIPCIDRILAAFDTNNESYKPTCLMVIGGAVISKKIKAFLRKSKLTLVWKIGEEFPEMETYQRLDRSFVMPPKDFLDKFTSNYPIEKNESEELYGNHWRKLFKETERKHDEFLERTEHSDFKVVDLVIKNIPAKSTLHLGNSSVARYAQLFNLKKQLEFHCNRGTSGIDGSVSTAAGAALKQKDQIHTLLVGDVSFFYDSNALWNNYLSDNLRIIMIHNGGGGIFEIIPGPSDSKFRDDFFVAKHTYNAEHLCRAFDVEYLFVNKFENLEYALKELYKPSENGRPKMLEIDTRQCDNAEILKSYFEYMKKC